MKVFANGRMIDDFATMIAEYRETLAVVPRGQRIVVIDNNKARYCAVMLAAFEQGVVTVPLAPNVDGRLKSSIASHSGVRAIFENGELSLFGNLHPPSPEDHRITIYTSGTTGSPKGVMLSRENVISNASTVAELHDFANKPHCTPLPLHHVNGLCMSLFGSYVANSVLVLADTFNPDSVFELCREHECGTVSLVPTLVSRLLERAPEWPSSLEYAISAAAPLTQRITSQFYSLYGPRLRQGYGLSEATNFSFLMPLQSAADFRQEMVDEYPPVGLPLPHTQFRIEEQEVVVKGPNVFMGYWDNPEATRMVLTDGWLKTGDIGEVRGDFLVLRGRKKEIILRGGETLYPVDLDAYYAGLGFEGAVAVAVEDEDLGEDIGLAVENTDPLMFVRALPSIEPHRRPCSVSNDTIPRTSTGKVQRKRIAQRMITGYLPASFVQCLEPENCSSSGYNNQVLNRQALIPFERALSDMRVRFASLNSLKLKMLEPGIAAVDCTGQNSTVALYLNLVDARHDTRALIERGLNSDSPVLISHLDLSEAMAVETTRSASRLGVFEIASEIGWSGPWGWSRLRCGRYDLGGLIWFGQLS